MFHLSAMLGLGRLLENSDPQGARESYERAAARLPPKGRDPQATP
jgi:hypothetical protein